MRHNVKDIEKYTFPEPNDRMLQGLREKISANKDKCLILEGLREPMFGLPSWLRGTTNFYMDLLANEAMAEALLDRIVEYYLKLLDFLLDRLGNDIDVVKFADDLRFPDESSYISRDLQEAHKASSGSAL